MHTNAHTHTHTQTHTHTHVESSWRRAGQPALRKRLTRRASVCHRLSASARNASSVHARARDWYLNVHASLRERNATGHTRSYTHTHTESHLNVYTSLRARNAGHAYVHTHESHLNVYAFRREYETPIAHVYRARLRSSYTGTGSEFRCVTDYEMTSSRWTGLCFSCDRTTDRPTAVAVRARAARRRPATSSPATRTRARLSHTRRPASHQPSASRSACITRARATHWSRTHPPLQPPQPPQLQQQQQQLSAFGHRYRGADRDAVKNVRI